MKSLLPLGFALALAGAFAMFSMPQTPDAQAADAEESQPKTLRHVVLFSFKESASDAEVQKVVDAFAELPKKIDTIKDFEYGTNNSPEGLDDGFTHCFLVTFDSEAGRATYLPHPAHKAFVEILKPHLEKALVVDYWAQ